MQSCVVLHETPQDAVFCPKPRNFGSQKVRNAVAYLKDSKLSVAGFSQCTWCLPKHLGFSSRVWSRMIDLFVFCDTFLRPSPGKSGTVPRFQFLSIKFLIVFMQLPKFFPISVRICRLKPSKLQCFLGKVSHEANWVVKVYSVETWRVWQLLESNFTSCSSFEKSQTSLVDFKKLVSVVYWCAKEMSRS